MGGAPHDQYINILKQQKQPNVCQTLLPVRGWGLGMRLIRLCNSNLYRLVTSC